MPSRILLAASSLLGAWCLGSGAAEPPAPKQEVPAIRPLAPKRVTLHARAIPLSKALDELARQTGIRVEDRRDQPDKEIRIDLREATFWQALDQIAAAAGARVDLYPRNGRIALVARGPGYRPPPVSYDGIFRCAVKRVSASRDLETGTEVSTALLEVAWEPDRPLFLLETRPQSLVVHDDMGRDVHAAAEGSASAFVDGQFALVFDVPLPALPRSVTRVGLLEGRLTAVGPSKMLTFAFDDLGRLAKAKPDAPERRLVQEGVGCAISRVVLDRDRWTVQVALDYPPGGKQLDSYQSWVVNNEMVLAAKDGRRRLESNTYVVESSSPRRAVVSYHFRDTDKGRRGRPDDWKLLYRTPASVIEMPIAFRFKDVPLP